MDCSGTISYLLNQAGIKAVPRQADTIYRWTWEQRTFYPVAGSTFNSFEYEHLEPGDLLFWTGTYSTNRDPDVSHVMIYLGTEKASGNKLMVGASDGRTFHNQSRYGVSVFDFKLPAKNATSRFIGYAKIPGLL